MIFDFLVTIFATIGISYALHVLIKLPIEAMTGERGGIAKYNQLHAEKREKHSRWMKEYLSKPENRAFLECSHKAKPVVCVETGVIYPSQCAAEKASGFRGVHKACTGEHHTCGGYHWRYADKGECSSFLG